MSDISERVKNILEPLKYPYKVFAAKTPYDDIMNAYQGALERGRKEGFTPVLVPARDVFEDYLERLDDDGQSIEGTLQAETRTGREILDERFVKYSGQNEDNFDMDLFIGAYEDEPDVISHHISLWKDEKTGETLETILLEVPTVKPWEVVAYVHVPFGERTLDCPPTSEMMAICRYWYEKYGAVPVIIASNVLEMSVPAPVGAEKALEVAKEHFAFTTARLSQGTRTYTLSEVAASVAVSKVWFFWWD